MKYLRRLPSGLAMLMLSLAIIALGAAVADALKDFLVIDLTGNQAATGTWVLNTTLSVGDSVELPRVNATYMIVAQNTASNTSCSIILDTFDRKVSNYYASIENATCDIPQAGHSSTSNTFAAKILLQTNNHLAIDISYGNGYNIYISSPTFNTVQIYRWVENSNGGNGKISLGFIPGMAVVFAGLFMFLRSLRVVAARV